MRVLIFGKRVWSFEKSVAYLVVGFLFVLPGCWSAKPSEISNCFILSKSEIEGFSLVNHCTKESMSLPGPTGEDIQPQWYHGEHGKISLQTFGSIVSCVVPLKGNSEYSALMLKIIHLESGKYHLVYFSPDDLGNYDFHYVLKDGQGEYKIIIYGISELEKSQPSVCFKVTASRSLPIGLNELMLNDRFVDYLQSSMGESIGTGDCWDLIQKLMVKYHADWSEGIELGISVDPEHEQVLPGDIIWFQNTMLDHSRGDMNPDSHFEYIGDPNHFALVFRLKGNTMFQIAHQNVTDPSMLVVSEIDTKKIIAGKVSIFRPIAGLLSCE